MHDDLIGNNSSLQCYFPLLGIQPLWLNIQVTVQLPEPSLGVRPSMV